METVVSHCNYWHHSEADLSIIVQFTRSSDELGILVHQFVYQMHDISVVNRLFTVILLPI